jgi:hypothetical protein
VGHLRRFVQLAHSMLPLLLMRQCGIDRMVVIVTFNCYVVRDHSFLVRAEIGWAVRLKVVERRWCDTEVVVGWVVVARSGEMLDVNARTNVRSARCVVKIGRL